MRDGRDLVIGWRFTRWLPSFSMVVSHNLGGGEVTIASDSQFNSMVLSFDPRSDAVYEKELSG